MTLRQFSPPDVAALSLEVAPAFIDEATYLRDYDERLTEWVEGSVIEMAAMTDQHNAMIRFLSALLEAYLTQTGEGRVFQDTFTMRFSTPNGKLRRRHPDVMVVCSPNLGRIQATYVDGAADLVIEIVSEDSVDRDRGEKFVEYEAAGVREYWIVDPLRQEVLFYRRGDDALFHLWSAPTGTPYTSAVLPRLTVAPDLLYRQPAPSVWDVVALVTAMLNL
jgi:Uma2 family endonuclease